MHSVKFLSLTFYVKSILEDAIFAILVALNVRFGHLGKFQPSENAIIDKNHKWELQNVLNWQFLPLKSLKVISRKIWVAGNFWHFHTVIKLLQIYDYLQKSQLNSKERERISDAQKYIKWTLAFINVVLIVLIGVLINCKYRNYKWQNIHSN